MLMSVLPLPATADRRGGEDGTPAGTVWFAWHIKGQTYTAVMHFAGDCETVLALAVRFALAQLLQLLL